MPRMRAGRRMEEEDPLAGMRRTLAGVPATYKLDEDNYLVPEQAEAMGPDLLDDFVQQYTQALGPALAEELVAAPARREQWQFTSNLAKDNAAAEYRRAMDQARLGVEAGQKAAEAERAFARGEREAGQTFEASEAEKERAAKAAAAEKEFAAKKPDPQEALAATLAEGYADPADSKNYDPQLSLQVLRNPAKAAQLAESSRAQLSAWADQQFAQYGRDYDVERLTQKFAEKMDQLRKQGVPEERVRELGEILNQKYYDEPTQGNRLRIAQAIHRNKGAQFGPGQEGVSVEEIRRSKREPLMDFIRLMGLLPRAVD